MTRYNKKNCTKVLGMIETPLKMYSFKSDINKKILTISQGRILNTIMNHDTYLPGQHDLSWECHKEAHVIVFHKLLEKDRYQRILLQNINFHVFMIWLTKRRWVLSESASKFASTSQADCQLQMPTWTVLLPSKTFFQSIHLWLVCLIKLIVFYHYLAISDFLIIHLHIHAIFWSSICLFIPVSSQFL